jgi:chromosomal replication initiation ATPase DnaA
LNLAILNKILLEKLHKKAFQFVLVAIVYLKKVLCDATEEMERKHRLEAMGYDFDTVVKLVSEIYKIESREILSPGKQPERVMARSVLAYWAVRELGISGTEVGKKLSLSQSAVSRAVKKGERLVSEHRKFFGSDHPWIGISSLPCRLIIHAWV